MHKGISEFFSKELKTAGCLNGAVQGNLSWHPLADRRLPLLILSMFREYMRLPSMAALPRLCAAYVICIQKIKIFAKTAHSYT